MNFYLQEKCKIDGYDIIYISSLEQQQYTFGMRLGESKDNYSRDLLKTKIESKEEFFCIKQRPKRMKRSLCFSQQIENQAQSLDSSLNSLKFQNPFKQCKELESTFGEQPVLAFKRKQPQKRRNLLKDHNKANRTGRNQTSSSASSRGKSPLKIILKQKKQEVKLSDFFVIEKIGRGTYSEVFKVICKKSGWIYALKVLQKSKVKQLGVEETIIREIKINLFLEHPNIAKLYTIFHDTQKVYLLCEFCTEGNLYQLVKSAHSHSVPSLISQIAQSLQYIHSHSIIHRDLKPENILLTVGNNIKICDFGWSIYNPNRQLRLTLCGTPLYLAPQMIAQTSYDQSIDTWALGVIAYELIMQKNPFQITKMRDLHKIVDEQIDLSEINDTIAADFISKATQKNPNQRHSIRELCLHSYLST